MKTTNWGGRKMVSSRYSEFLLELEEYIDENETMFLEVAGNSAIQQLVAAGKKEPDETITLLNNNFLSRLLKFTLGSSFTVVPEKVLLKDVLDLAKDNSATTCMLSSNANSQLCDKLKAEQGGRVKQLFSDTNSINEMLQFLMSKGIDIVVSDIDPQIARQLRQTCKEKYHKNLLWIQLPSYQKETHPRDSSTVQKSIIWLKEGSANAVCAWKVIRFRNLVSQGNR